MIPIKDPAMMKNISEMFGKATVPMIVKADMIYEKIDLSLTLNNLKKAFKIKIGTQALMP